MTLRAWTGVLLLVGACGDEMLPVTSESALVGTFDPASGEVWFVEGVDDGRLIGDGWSAEVVAGVATVEAALRPGDVVELEADGHPTLLVIEDAGWTEGLDEDAASTSFGVCEHLVPPQD